MFLGEHELPLKAGETERKVVPYVFLILFPIAIPFAFSFAFLCAQSDDCSRVSVCRVFAQRIGTSHPVWNSFLRRWQWERFASKTVPVLPERRHEHILIPWPKSQPTIHADGALSSAIRSVYAANSHWNFYIQSYAIRHPGRTSLESNIQTSPVQPDIARTTASSTYRNRVPPGFVQLDLQKLGL